MHQAPFKGKPLTSSTLLRKILTTSLVALVCGAIVEGCARLFNLYVFHPGWLIWVAIFGVYGGVIGLLSVATSSLLPIWQFCAGSMFFITAELLNQCCLELWVFNPKIFVNGIDPRVSSILVGLAAGIIPVLVNAAAASLLRSQDHTHR
jgi:hypothetical protein